MKQPSHKTGIRVTRGLQHSLTVQLGWLYASTGADLGQHGCQRPNASSGGSPVQSCPCSCSSGHEKAAICVLWVKYPRWHRGVCLWAVGIPSPRTWGSQSCAAGGEREVAACAQAVARFAPISCEMLTACSCELAPKGSSTGKHFHQQPCAGRYHTRLITLPWRGKVVSGLKKSLGRCWRLLLHEEV